MNNPPEDRILLGLEIARARHPGKVMSVKEIAAWADCCPQRIEQLTAQALKKARNALKKMDIQEI